MGETMETTAGYLERRHLLGRSLAISVRLQSAIALVSVTTLALVLNAWGLSRAGWGNTYYSAAVRSMTVSWKNFFFGAFDPGGFITVDKPPVFLWVDALSARAFGYSQWSILLPSAIAGAASVALLWLIVRRYFGAAAATIAAVVLALSPISVAVNRLNLPEPFLILALLGAAGAVLKSLESGRWWIWAALAGLLVGVAFNIKMLAGWIPGPAFALAIVVAIPVLSRTSLKRMIGRLAVLGVVTFAVSASWMVVVDAWPASQRPFIGGSTNNTVLDLALGYNGFGRVEGEGVGGSPGGGARPANMPSFNSNNAPALPNGVQPNDGAFDGTRQDGGSFNGVQPGSNLPGSQSAGNTPPTVTSRGGGGFRGAGGIIAGIPGIFRMFDDANGGQIGWLLPFAFFGGLVALWQWRRNPVRRAFVVVFLGWVILYAAVFSYARGIYHSYYTYALAPGIAALVGVGAVSLARLIRRNPLWLVALLAVVGVTVWTQLTIAGRTPDFFGWVRPFTIAVAAAGVILAIIMSIRRPRFLLAPIALSVVGLLLIPAAWSVSAATNPSVNATLPQAGATVGASSQSFGSQAFDSGDAQLAAWLKTHNDPDATWQLVVSSAQNASTLIAQYDISVMGMGGFSGNDKAMTISHFADLVSQGRVRYVLASEGMMNVPGFNWTTRSLGNSSLPSDSGTTGTQRLATALGNESGATAVMSAVQSACTLVTDSSLPSRYQNSLYDCSGASSALSSLGGN
jgi:4-amino-4-deoxy-L-arabinose transferase-like glycosyltransferase